MVQDGAVRFAKERDERWPEDLRQDQKRGWTRRYAGGKPRDRIPLPAALSQPVEERHEERIPLLALLIMDDRAEDRTVGLDAEADGECGSTPARRGRASLRYRTPGREDLSIHCLERVEADLEPALQAPAGVTEVAVARRRQKMNERGKASDQWCNLGLEAPLRAGVPDADPVNECRVIRKQVAELDSAEPAFGWRRPTDIPLRTRRA